MQPMARDGVHVVRDGDDARRRCSCLPYRASCGSLCTSARFSKRLYDVARPACRPRRTARRCSRSARSRRYRSKPCRRRRWRRCSAFRWAICSPSVSGKACCRIPRRDCAGEQAAVKEMSSRYCHRYTSGCQAHCSSNADDGARDSDRVVWSAIAPRNEGNAIRPQATPATNSPLKRF